jgi:hypothetical protein
MPVISAASEE